MIGKNTRGIALPTLEELDKIAVDDNADVPALHGWRRELFGESALAIKSGRLAMSIRNGHIVTYPLDEAFGENDGQSASPVTAGAD